MKYNAFLGLMAATALMSGPAFAGKWDAEKELCGHAVASEADLSPGDYRVKLTKARDRAVKRVTIELIADGDVKAVGECKIRHDQIIDVELKA